MGGWLGDWSVSCLAQGEVDADTVPGLLCIVLDAGQGTFVGLVIGLSKPVADRSIVTVKVLAQGDNHFRCVLIVDRSIVSI